MRTSAAYLESLRALDRRVFVDGERVLEPVEHPLCRPAANAVALTYGLAETDKYRELATGVSHLTGKRVNRFTHLFTEPEDLVMKIQLQRVLGQLTGTCFQRCVGLDGMNALFAATWSAGAEAHERFCDWLTGVQERDEVICGAMTDAKGNRALRPVDQPEQFLRVVERREDGLVIRGLKLHQTGALNAHQILVMPGLQLRPGEEDFAFAAAVSVEAPGLSFMLGRQPSDRRKGTADAGNSQYGGQEAVVVFDDVFVPHEQVFLDGDLASCHVILESFAGYHRSSYGGCKPGNLDVLIGAVTDLVDGAGLRRKAGVRDKLIEMVYLTESIHGLGLAAAQKAERHGSGVWRVDPMLANVCKQAVTRLPYEVGRMAEDLAGGLTATLPSMDFLDHPEMGDWMHLASGGRERAAMYRLVEYMTYGAGAVPLRIECMHGAGSPAAQRIAMERLAPWEEKVSFARSLASPGER